MMGDDKLDAVIADCRSRSEASGDRHMSFGYGKLAEWLQELKELRGRQAAMTLPASGMQLYLYLLKPYTIHDDSDGSDTEVRGDVYVGAMPEAGESVIYAWFTDSEKGCAGTVNLTLESLRQEVERYCPITLKADAETHSRNDCFERMKASLDSIQERAVAIATAQTQNPREQAAQISILCAEARQAMRE